MKGARRFCSRTVRMIRLPLDRQMFRSWLAATALGAVIWFAAPPSERHSRQYGSSDRIEYLQCRFTRLKYDPAFYPSAKDQPEQPLSIANGEFKFAAPNKWLYHEIEVRSLQVNEKTYRQEVVLTNHGEHWSSDGKTLFQFDDQRLTATEIPIPPERNGDWIFSQMLSFFAGVNVAELNERYQVRTITPADDQANNWLDLTPRYMREARNFAKVQLILRKSDMVTTAVQIFPTLNGEHEVFILELPQSGSLSNSDANPFLPATKYKRIPNRLPLAANESIDGATRPPNDQRVQPLPLEALIWFVSLIANSR